MTEISSSRECHTQARSVGRRFLVTFARGALFVLQVEIITMVFLSSSNEHSFCSSPMLLQMTVALISSEIYLSSEANPFSALFSSFSQNL